VSRKGRSHPPSLLRLAERLIRDERLLARGEVVLCACSGGPDSTALLHALALLRPRIGHEVAALGVDHGLRAEAAAELSIAAELSAALSVPFSVARVSVAPGSNLQARARAARLGALLEGARRAGARAIATGHTADDRAETFLLRLLRGSGPRGLAVLPPKASFPGPVKEPLTAAPAPDAPNERAPSEELPALIRPLLRARRADVMAHLTRHAIAYASDPSNQDPRFTRVRVRRELLPLLEELSPNVVEHLTSLADMLGAASIEEPEGPVALGREHRRAIERARRLGRRSVKIRVEDGRDVEATFPDGKIVLIEEDTP
jgi:tRNA(Ile)-lysidine synthase